MSFDNERFYENIKPTLDMLQALNNKITAGIQNVIQSEAVQNLLATFASIPKEVQDTWLYKTNMTLKDKKDIRLEDVEWIPANYGLNDVEVVEENLKGQHYPEDSLESYVSWVILFRQIEKREKLVILLSHMEPLIYEAIGKNRERWERVKDQAEKNVDSKDVLNMSAIEAVYVLAITFVIFSNTDSYEKPIDRRMPFRNNILYRGVLEYSEDEVNAAYAYLVECIAVLLIAVGGTKGVKFNQTVFTIDEDA